jgi:hypothetical protein
MEHRYRYVIPHRFIVELLPDVRQASEQWINDHKTVIWRKLIDLECYELWLTAQDNLIWSLKFPEFYNLCWGYEQLPEDEVNTRNINDGASCEPDSPDENSGR